MIHVIGGLKIPAKQAYGEKVIQTSLDMVEPLLNQSPDISHMDLLIINAKEVPLVKKNKFIKLLEGLHKDVEICIFDSDKKSKFAGLRNVTVVNAKSVTKDIIHQHVDPMLARVAARAEKRISVTEEELLAVETVDKFDKIYVEEVHDSSIPDSGMVRPYRLDLPSEDSSSSSSSDISIFEDESATAEEVEEKFIKARQDALEEMIQGRSINPDALMSLLNADSIASKLLRENSAFQGAVQMLDVLDAEIANIFKNTTLSPTEKFVRIRDLGFSRASHKDVVNNMISSRLLELLNQVVTIVYQITEERINDIQLNLEKLVSVDAFIYNEEAIRKDQELRLKSSIRINATIDEIIAVYNVINRETAEFLKDLAKDLPSKNPFINNMMAHMSHYFLPPHVDTILNTVTRDVRSGARMFDILEDKLTRLNVAVFDYVRHTDSALAEQNKLINLLKNNRVEEIIIPDTILKSALRAFIGVANTGRTATVVMHSEIQARRRNVLVISFTESKFSDYGIRSADIQDFFSGRLMKNILYLNANVHGDLELLQDYIHRIIPRLEHYHYVNLIFDNTQSNMIDAIHKDLLSVTFITNSSTYSISSMIPIVENFKYPNVARRLVVIDPPKNIPSLLDKLKVDLTITKLITIPHLNEIREFAIRGLNPINNMDIEHLYTTAFSI